MKTRKNFRVLYLAPYSAKAYGAEEQDLESGWKLLQSMNDLDVYIIKFDLQQNKIITELTNIEFQYKLGFRDKCTYLVNLFFTADNAMRQAYSFKNYEFITKIIIDLGIDVIFTNTTSTVLFGNQKRAKHVFRSVSFEPVYVLKTVKNYFLAHIHSLLKLLSVFQELRADCIVAISPRDSKYYKISSIFTVKHKLSVIPLRQLAFHNTNKLKVKRNDDLNIGFMGSTYNVLHNRKSFDFINEELNYDELNSQRIVVNIYGRKIPNSTADRVNLHIHNYVNNLTLIYQTNHVFLVPFFLSSGMQSKVFEPLFYGKILVCDPRVLAGYDFKPFVHYIPARTPEDFMQAINWIKRNRNKANQIGKNAMNYSSLLFSKKVFKSRLRLALDLD